MEQIIEPKYEIPTDYNLQTPKAFAGSENSKITPVDQCLEHVGGFLCYEMRLVRSVMLVPWYSLQISKGCRMIRTKERTEGQVPR